MTSDEKIKLCKSCVKKLEFLKADVSRLKEYGIEDIEKHIIWTEIGLDLIQMKIIEDMGDK